MLLLLGGGAAYTAGTANGMLCMRQRPLDRQLPHSIIMSEGRICTPGSLAARVEDAVFTVYGAAGTERVRGSLHALDTGVSLDRRLADGELMVQQANSYIDDLTPKPWHDASQHKWAKQLEKKWTVVRDELRASLRNEARLAATGNNVWGGLDASISEYGQEWKTLPLCDRTVWDETNSALFPKTCALLTKSKVPLVEAFFAKMGPNSDIKPHSDMCNVCAHTFANDVTHSHSELSVGTLIRPLAHSSCRSQFVLTSHLGVDVPEGECDLTVGDETVEWRNGKVTLFDTSILHKAENRASVTRYILMMRVYHPELSQLERSALKLVFDCLDEPELLEDREALGEYHERRAAVEAASRRAWEKR